MARKTTTERAPRKTNGKAEKANGTPRTGYDAFKEFRGQRYTGMKVGRGHHWNYDAGQWIEKKVTPDLWEFCYAVTKRRKGRAPEGSGVPVGTAYHWYILADQTVTKQDANSYTTDMVGVKYKLAHKRADKETWSASDQAQRRRLIQLLEDMIAQLKKGPAQEAALDESAKRQKSAKPVKSTKPARARKSSPRAKERPRAAA
jgi:hypothetical protein